MADGSAWTVSGAAARFFGAVLVAGFFGMALATGFGTVLAAGFFETPSPGVTSPAPAPAPAVAVARDAFGRTADVRGVTIVRAGALWTGAVRTEDGRVAAGVVACVSAE
ncbi:hypothetical protein E3T23_06785 [Cryobacterium cheniae]|uniref:Uncharacterized protein n=1 Tax=Cryobacterium cheniae TaxID=1259262 RepID=A0A4R8XUV7_9MICO|nr:hypothetical protein [Cryobacterium cheniae]TFC81190.1 hypothetical protein E3T23_06785 [Cryobacterium cheniae]